jgi:Luciferase-like monooxygenase
MDECMDIVRGLTSGGYFEYHGEFYDLQSIKICPVPTEPIPLLVGGHADAALRRAVLRGDGWMHGGGAPEELDALLSKIETIRRAEGVADRPFEIHVISLDAYSADGIKRLEDRGVTDVIVGFRIPYQVGPDTEPLAKKIEHLDRYAESVIAKVG